jgi:hypothetical protein
MKICNAGQKTSRVETIWEHNIKTCLKEGGREGMWLVPLAQVRVNGGPW